MDQQAADFEGFVSTPLTQELVEQADLIYTMTMSHKRAIVSRWPQAVAKTQLLDAQGLDVLDPIGSPQQVYDQTAYELKALIQKRFEQWPAPQKAKD